MTGRFNITNDNELRCAYELAHIMHLEKTPKYADLRHEMRAYNRQKKSKHLVKLYDDGSYIELVNIGLPVGVYDKDFASMVFECDYYIEAYPSAYDCTGQAFTSWYHLFERGGMWCAYHYVGLDV